MRAFSRLLLLGGLVAFLVGLVWIGMGTGYFASADSMLSDQGGYLYRGLLIAGGGIAMMGISIMF